LPYFWACEAFLLSKSGFLERFEDEVKPLCGRPDGANLDTSKRQEQQQQQQQKRA